MIEFLVNAFEPLRNGGVLPPTLAWAAERVAASFRLQSPVAVLQELVTVGNDTASSLEAELGSWAGGRVGAHVAYFCLCGVAASAWLAACAVLIVATVAKERRRRRRLAAGDAADAVDGDGGVGSAAEPSRYVLFYDMLQRRARRLREQASSSQASATKRQASDFADDVPDGGVAAGGASWPDGRPVRIANFSKKSLNAKDPALLCLTVASLLLVAVCLSLLVASLTQVGSIATFTSTGDGAGGVRAMAVATVGHVDAFLNRSLSESNATIIRISRDSFPHVERLFLDFGQQLLDSLLDDFNITALIGELQTFLGAINSTMETMRSVAASRDATIRPLHAFAVGVDERREAVTPRTEAVCRRLGHPRCADAVARLRRLSVPINDTRLDTDTSVTIVTLINRMLRLDIGNVQRQIEDAQAALRNSLGAISDVVRSLLDSLVEQVSAQFNEAERLIAGVKAQYDAAVADPRLWSTVDRVHASVVALICVTCLAFAVAFVLGCCLLTFLLRHLCIGARLNRYERRCPPTSAAVAGSFASLKLQDANNNRRGHQATLSGGFGEHWMDLDADLPDATAASPAPPTAKLALPRRQLKVTRLATKERNSFVYCCSIDCSVLLLLAAIATTLPLLMGCAIFYFSAWAHVDACRYVATNAGQRQWDSLIDNFTQRHVWPKVEAALMSQDALPIVVPQYPSRLLRAVSSDCSNSSRSLFDIFGLVHALNASAILQANATRQQFEIGAQLLRDQINGTDVNSLIPPELDSLKAVLPQIASVMDEQDYSASISELQKPLLEPSDHRQLLLDLQSIAQAALLRDGSDRDAVIVLYEIQKFNDSLRPAAGIAERLQQLRASFQHLQDSRILGQLTTRLLEALAGVESAISDKSWMLRQVDVRFYSILEKHLPKFAAFLDPLAVSVLRQVGFCDDLSRAYHTVAGDLCDSAVARINTAAFLLVVTTLFFGCLIVLCWLLLLRVRRHQAAAAQFELLRLHAASAC